MVKNVELTEFIYQARHIVLDMAELMLQAASNEDIKKEPKIQHKLVSTALALLTEARTLETELNDMSNLRSNNSIAE